MGSPTIDFLPSPPSPLLTLSLLPPLSLSPLPPPLPLSVAPSCVVVVFGLNLIGVPNPTVRRGTAVPTLLPVSGIVGRWARDRLKTAPLSRWKAPALSRATAPFVIRRPVTATLSRTLVSRGLMLSRGLSEVAVPPEPLWSCRESGGANEGRANDKGSSTIAASKTCLAPAASSAASA